MATFDDSDLDDLEIVLPTPLVTPKAVRHRQPPPSTTLSDNEFDDDWKELVDAVGLDDLLKSAEKHDRPLSPPRTPTRIRTPPSANPEKRRMFANPNARVFRPPRPPRKTKLGEWDEDLSESENVEKLRRHRLALNRRRMKYRPDNSMAMVPREKRKRQDSHDQYDDEWNDVVGSVGLDDLLDKTAGPSRKRPRSRLRPLVREPGEDDRSYERRKRVRRAGRDETPEWLDVADEHQHKYNKLVHLDGSYRALKEFTKLEYEAEFTDYEGDRLCGVCDGQHSTKVCPKRQAKNDIGTLHALLGFK